MAVNMNEYIKARDEYIRLIKSELLGPGSEISIPDSEHEVISDTPMRRYSVGVLFPKNNMIGAENDEETKIKEDGSSDGVINEEITEVDEPVTEDVDDKDIKKARMNNDDENLDEEVSLASQNMPSSMGISFFVKGCVQKVWCSIKFGIYRKTKTKDCLIPLRTEFPEKYELPNEAAHLAFFDKSIGCLRLCDNGITRKKVNEIKEKDKLDELEIDALYKLATQLRSGYVREPHAINLELDFCGQDYIDQNKDLDGTKAKVTALKRKITDDMYSVTIMLVNECEAKPTAELCLFQPEIYVSTENNDFVFCESSKSLDLSLMDFEEKSLALQYRNKKAYATGLGTAASWNIDKVGKGIIRSDFFPEVEVPSVDFSLPAGAKVDSVTLSMKYLSDLDKSTKSQKIQNLQDFIDCYNDWIEKQKNIAQKLDEQFRNIANINISACEASYRRMVNGLKTLQENDRAWDAFQLANRAMYMQRIHLKLQSITADKDRFNGDKELCEILSKIDYLKPNKVVDDRYTWRPFQLAFLVMSVDSICKEESLDREIVDLIWFPTGGGKTEAYLGLTAFTIFFRRLEHLKASSGTTVIMRYTLRLLAAQQFTRASTLICACEYIRQDSVSKKPKYGKYNLGSELISIGLWIGGEHTPNKNKGLRSAKEELDYLLDANEYNLREIKNQHNKFQVLKCPWCGTKLVKEVVNKKLVGDFGYYMKNNSHFRIYCPQEDCFFGEQDLPIQVVDEELYANPPTLLFGTVDKFAMLPWNEKTGAFFAVGKSHRPPELIIQDELHLISGPLGTIVGLYETLIDVLCKEKGISTKIVASTATIRRAKEQCASLYNREVYQFPSPGVNAEDSFFASESNIEYEKNTFGRKYIGLMPSGKTKAMMEIRTISALMQTIKNMCLSDEIKDKYWTLTVYFNSLKDLGKCSVLVDDDVKDFIKRMAYRLGTSNNARGIANADELTSRVSTTELNETLDKLEKISYSKENVENKRYASNILLATNMISVGIDIARLNTMVLVGQPKLTSEYIQASSRVGRTYPGLAFALYDGSKSRDRSHYEQFKAYHESFYRYVEPTAVTPFSKPARDRALHSLVIALLRFLESDLKSDSSAKKFRVEKYKKTIDKITNIIVERNKNIISKTNSAMKDDASEIKDEICTILKKWENLAENFESKDFYYGERYLVAAPGQDEGRLLKAFNTSPFDSAFDTMTSMRNVDSTSAVSVLLWEK